MVVNRAPVIKPVDQITIREGDTADPVKVVASDADGDTPKFTLTKSPSFVSLKDNENGTATLVFSQADFNSSGTHEIIIKATDPQGAFTTRTVTSRCGERQPSSLGCRRSADVVVQQNGRDIVLRQSQ